jgi:glycosyltransferase involved in cell wall biosynthesis
MPILSIIIPCYNTELTLNETLESVLNQNFEDWEAIIINDGSPDKVEKVALNWVKKDSRFIYYKKENGGLGSARNFGIKKAKGEFILPLDSDNKIKPNFANKALEILKINQSVGVVYGDAEYFGSKSGIWKVGQFNEYKLLVSNYIDACAIIRKSLFFQLDFYDEKLPYQGHEDWEFWIRVVDSEYDFYYLNEVAYEYRVTQNSMIRKFDSNMLKINIDYIKRKHFDIYMKYFNKLYSDYSTNLKSEKFVLNLFLKTFFGFNLFKLKK